MRIRKERSKDQSSIYALHSAAFERKDEAEIVNELREEVEPLISLVATEGSKIVGHILFSPVSVQQKGNIMGLAPMAVLPHFQARGIGSLLVEKGLEQCQESNIGAVVVLGDPQYYPRFGFSPAHRFGLNCVFDVPQEAFMVKELATGFLDNICGVVKYHQAFEKNIG